VKNRCIERLVENSSAGRPKTGVGNDRYVQSHLWMLSVASMSATYSDRKKQLPDFRVFQQNRTNLPFGAIA
jgi:hypothetical protein